MSDLEAPIFDEFVLHTAESVVHKNTEGEVFAWHSPLADGPVHCTLCETPGTRVYL